MKGAPCKPNGKDCERRTLGCSRTCEEFLAWQEYKNGIKAERAKDVETFKPIGRRLKDRNVY